MTDLAAMLREAADSIDVRPGADLVDADLHRGRRAASRIRTRRFITGGGAIAGLAAVALTVGLTQGSASPRPAQLVAYSGYQAPGFTVDQVPAGWTVQGSTGVGTDDPTDGPAVTIAPADDTDTDPSHVDGKLVVRGGVTATEPGSVHVGDVVGSTENADGSGTVFFVVRVNPDGAELVLQVPSSLDWTRTQAAAFTEGVHVAA